MDEEPVITIQQILSTLPVFRKVQTTIPKEKTRVHIIIDDLPIVKWLTCLAVSSNDSKENVPIINPGCFVGWQTDKPGTCLKPIKNIGIVNIELRATRVHGYSLQHHSGNTSSNGCGILHCLKDRLWSLSLKGTRKERGIAHGEILANHILDFFEFYIIEERIANTEKYEKMLIDFKNKFRIDADFEEEIKGIYEGMLFSGVNMHIPLLSRDFTYYDLLALNAILDSTATGPVGCTQFAAFGNATHGSDVSGGTILGRNMDGEIDIRKVTVTHFLLFAHESCLDNKVPTKRFISAMWPGFVGTVTAVNEDGIYCMENAGNNQPAPAYGGVVPVAWTIRRTMEIFGKDRVLTPNSAKEFFHDFVCEGGGVDASGGIFLISAPSSSPRAFIFESDRIGYDFRFPGDVRPFDSCVIMASNHFLKYGISKSNYQENFDDKKPPYISEPSQVSIFGKSVSSSSSWRYEVGMQMIEAWLRNCVPIGTGEIVRLLQSTCHGTTEHSLVVRVDKKPVEIDVAIADVVSKGACVWDAPYTKWVSINFNECFGEFYQ